MAYISHSASALATLRAADVQRQHTKHTNRSIVTNKPSLYQKHPQRPRDLGSLQLKSLHPILMLLLPLLTLQFPQQTRPYIINTPMHLQSRRLLRLNHNRILPHRPNPRLHILLHKLNRPLLLIQMLPMMLILLPQPPHRRQPRIQQAQTPIRQRGINPAAANMAADDDVLHFEVLDGVVDDGLGGDVRGGEDVGDVAVHEYLAWIEV